MSATKLWQAGYTDLVSVIPPRAELAATSKIAAKSRGKAPGRQRLDGKWTGYPFLTQPLSERDVQTMEAHGANVGLHGQHFPGLDIDSEDESLTRFVIQEAQRILGPAPIRTSRPPRRLLVYRTDQPFPRLRATITYKGQDHVLEVLGQGRQYLVHGTHPSGREYGWEGKPLWQHAPDSLSEITAEGVIDFFERLRRKLTGRAEVRIAAIDADEAPPPPQEDLLADSIEALRELVEHIPNDYLERDTYVQVGYAIKAAAGPEHEAEALDIFTEWAGRWTEGDNAPETVAADWSGMHGPYRIGWDFLARMKGAAPIAAALEFEADPGAEPPEPGVGVPGLSDVWVVETLARRLADRLRYVPEASHFHHWGD
jgi:hypothetical protein